MRGRYAYSIILVVVIAAWFAKDNIKPVRPSAKPQDTNRDVVASLVTDPSTLGVASSDWTPGGQCNIESINRKSAGNDMPVVSKDRPFELSGWALNPEQERLPQQVVVQFAGARLGNYFGLTRTGLMRDDVKTHFSLQDRLAPSGFGFIANIQDVAAGNYQLRLLLQFADATYVCDNGRRVEVR